MQSVKILIGLARAGKSTYCQAHREDKNTVIISGDAIRRSITGERFNLESELYVKANFVATAKAMTHQGYNVILDDTHTHHHNLQNLLTIFPCATAVIFHTPVEVCKQRAIDCGFVDLIPSIDRMNNNLSKTLRMISKGEIKIYYEEIGPEFRYIRSGYWDK